MNYKELLNLALNAALQAGKKILTVYTSDSAVITYKSDKSPVTQADIISNSIIRSYLNQTDIPVLSEEDKETDFYVREKWDCLWLVDPLDGTKEFINKNGDFTVNIALIVNTKPLLGVIYAPCTNTLYYGSSDTGSFFTDTSKIINPVKVDELIKVSLPLPRYSNNKKFTVVASRSHSSEKNNLFIENLKSTYKNISVINRGSSLKLCLIAEGSADIYPRYGTTMEWDIAAGHAIVNNSGGKVVAENTNTELVYNKPDLKNPGFIALGLNFKYSEKDFQMKIT